MNWNIVVVVSDTLRTAIFKPYGNDWVHTPNLARFANDGVRFTNAQPRMLANNSDTPHPTHRQTCLSI